jgi:hypothetical protein
MRETSMSEGEEHCRRWIMKRTLPSMSRAQPSDVPRSILMSDGEVPVEPPDRSSFQRSTRPPSPAPSREAKTRPLDREPQARQARAVVERVDGAEPAPPALTGHRRTELAAGSEKAFPDGDLALFSAA